MAIRMFLLIESDARYRDNATEEIVQEGLGLINSADVIFDFGCFKAKIDVPENLLQAYANLTMTDFVHCDGPECPRCGRPNEKPYLAKSAC